MAYQFFKISIAAPDEGQKVLNRFLASHVVHAVDRQWYGAEGAWCFCVEFSEAIAAGGPKDDKSSRIDYKEVLDEPDFHVFSALREVRREIHDESGAPLYAIFSNEQLAEMARRRPKTLAEFRAIPKIGEKKANDWGTRFLAAVTTAEKELAKK